ncbi:hypothetical protein [Nocardioides ochotonae]|uniref:hypothetical protein n=1 Tax=Nocardioides ochotonae TaxID=2685869 RepID=UPI00140B2E84|nr:hypothetical protein [Nocardioides ochotonae]
MPLWVSSRVWTSNRRPSAAWRRCFSAPSGSKATRGLVDESLDRGPADLPHEAGELAVDELCTVQRQGGGQLRESASLPQRHLSGADQLPGELEPVRELEGITDQRAGGVGGQAEGGAELHGCELRDQRRAFTSERDGQLPEHQPIGPVG